MEIITNNKTVLPSAGELMQQLKTMTNIPTIFRPNCSEDDMYKLLYMGYRAAVEARDCIFEDDSRTKKNIKALAVAITSARPKFGIMLNGNPGNGKTTLQAAFGMALMWLSSQGIFGEPKKLRVVSAKEVIAASKDWNAFNELRRSEMLAIDDFGEEPVEVMDYGNVTNPTIDLLEYRYNCRLFTFITTNLTGKKILERYKARIVDRLNEMCTIIPFEKGSYRK